MLLCWNVRCLDTRDKESKDRILWLDTNDLLPETKAEVELCLSTSGSSVNPKMLEYRHFFKEEHVTTADLEKPIGPGGWRCFSIEGYFEDDAGNPLSEDDVARIVTGNPTAFAVPSGTPQYHIDYMLAKKDAVDFDQISQTGEQLELLGYFSRDFRTVSESAFMKDGPGTLCSNSGDRGAIVRSAVTEDELTSFLATFRQLYMEKEPANFCKTAQLVIDVLAGHPLGQWVSGATDAYGQKLKSPPDFPLLMAGKNFKYSRKRLIDVYLYTRVIHQPKDDIGKKYQKCLDEVGGKQELLTFLFLTSVWQMVLAMGGPGRVIVGFYDHYCDHHGIRPDIHDSIGRENLGIGTEEKKSERDQRLLREKAEELAKAKWESEGQPAGGYTQFLDEAKERLRKLLE